MLLWYDLAELTKPEWGTYRSINVESCPRVVVWKEYDSNFTFLNIIFCNLLNILPLIIVSVLYLVIKG